MILNLRLPLMIVAWLAWSSAVCLCETICQAAHGLSEASPAEVGLDADRLAQMQSLITEAIESGKLPGCVVCVGRHGKLAYLEAFGDKQIEPQRQAMTTDTVFDMASITKPVATATSIMKLVELGQLRLGDRVADFFPAFSANGKEAITIQDLLIHQSGLIPDNPLSDYAEGAEEAWRRICDLGLVAPVATTFKYSDVNFIVLAEIIRKVSGQDVHEFSQQNIFRPLGMRETGFLPEADLRARAAPTERRDEVWMQGDVHDPRAYALGGVAGHAGLFSTARDLALYAQMMLDRGTLPAVDGRPPQRILSPQTIATMTRGYAVSSGIRGLGWDKLTGYSSNRGDLLSEAAFGHGGFTGTVLWIDPKLDLFFIFLSNRLHPDGDGSVNHLAGRIANVVASSIIDTDRRQPPRAAVLTGIDVLVQDNFRELAEQRVGLITNHTGRSRDGRSTADLMHESPAVALSALFSPEHGFEGKLDVAKIQNSADQQTGLEIFSLYGETRKPTAEMLQGIDTLVFDIQDIGTRFYTYISTMGEAMQAAAEHGKRFVVLDRPNPINGVDVAGPMLDPGLESFVGFHRLPVRHAMTTGEIAQMLKQELQLSLELEVVACQGWQREEFFESTNLTWVNPSPNMRSLTQALLYPGVGLLETTNVSVGRGTDTPFEVVGAPWIDGQLLAAQLNAQALPGVVYVPIEFTPDASKYAQQLCQGVNIIITDRDRFEPLRCGLDIACHLRKLFPEGWESQHFNRLLGNAQVFQAVVDGKDIDEVMQLASQDLGEFIRRREAFLIYP